MSDTLIKQVTQNLNKIKTYGPLRVAQGDTLRVIYKILARKPENVTVLNLRRTAIEKSLHDSKTRKADEAVSLIELQRQRQEITSVYVEIAGIEGYETALENVSLAEAVTHSIANAPKVIGEAIGTTVAGVGNTAGSLIGGILSGIGPILFIVIIVIVMLRKKV